MLAGLQEGWTKYPCFLCDWDSRFYGIGAERMKQYKNNTWVAREKTQVKGNLNQINKPLVKYDKILVPPLHIKLGLVKSFVKNVAQKKEVFEVLREIFPKICKTESRLKAGMTY